MALALVAVAGNLRLAITSVPPLIDAISSDLGLSNTAAGALTTLPVLCMGVFAPLANRVAHRLGATTAVLAAVAVLLVGAILRFTGGQIVLLYLSSLFAGVGIAVAGALLPRLVKALFPPQRSGLVTGLYMLAMVGGAALASALSVPLADRFGSWQASLGSWSVVALVGLLAWAPVATRARPHYVPDEQGAGRLPWRHPTAWMTAGYLALQSICFFSAVAWLAPTYLEQGWSRADAGYLTAAFSGVQVLSGLLGPVISDKVHDLRYLLVPAATLNVVGCLGVHYGPEVTTWAPWLWVVVTGLGQGAAFALGLVLLVSYAATPSASGRLTGMCFLVAYSTASLGPLAMGAVRDVTGDLSLVWLILGVVGAGQAAVALRLRPDLSRVA